MTYDAQPFLVRLTLDLNSGLPVSVQIISSNVTAQHVGGNLVIEKDTLSCDAMVIPQGSGNPNAVAFVTFFHPELRHNLPENHIRHHAINKTPFIPLSRELASSVKDGEWVRCELDHKTQSILKVTPCRQKEKNADTVLVSKESKTSIFETLYQGGVIVFNYVYLNRS